MTYQRKLRSPDLSRGNLQIDGLEFPIKTTSNSTPPAAFKIERQTLHLEQVVDLASPGPVSWVAAVFLPRRQTVEVLWEWAAETRRP